MFLIQWLFLSEFRKVIPCLVMIIRICHSVYVMYKRVLLLGLLVKQQPEIRSLLYGN